MQFLTKFIILIVFLFPLSSFASVSTHYPIDTVSNCVSSSVNDYSGLQTGYIVDNYDCAHYPISTYTVFTSIDRTTVNLFDSNGACISFADIYNQAGSLQTSVTSGCATNVMTIDGSLGLSDGTYVLQFQMWYWPHYVELGFTIVDGSFYFEPEQPLISTPLVIATSTATGTPLNYTDPPSYLDWITVNLIQIFLLALLSFSFIFQLFTRHSKSNTW